MSVDIRRFSPSTEVNLTFDGEIVATVTTNSSGYANVSFSAPTRSANIYILSAIDANNETSAQYVVITASDPGTPNPLIPGFEIVWVITGVVIGCLVLLSMKKKNSLS